jgi:hypothetical protein
MKRLKIERENIAEEGNEKNRKKRRMLFHVEDFSSNVED